MTGCLSRVVHGAAQQGQGRGRNGYRRHGGDPPARHRRRRDLHREAVGAEPRRAAHHAAAIGLRGRCLVRDDAKCPPPQVGRQRHRRQPAQHDGRVEPAALVDAAHLAAPEMAPDLSAQRPGLPTALVIEDGGQFPAVFPLGSGQQQRAQ